ncbi:hypothetical protein PS862_04129 [Pseudomonas fluorescens]|uniref:Uncharacterized protein n=1 Tax=Pseudomonas fluorescens TaxID=294 RepID=A0A5E7MNR1_PSEFL|nr:hypothetical protein PS862_04129 [Pseudomonas fluorescens]
MAKRYELPDAAWELVADLFIEPGTVVAQGQMIA